MSEKEENLLNEEFDGAENASVETSETEEKKSSDKNQKRWYIVHTYSYLLRYYGKIE